MAPTGNLPRVAADNPLFLRDDWPAVRKRVVGGAFRFVSRHDLAEELVQYAIAFCLDDKLEAWKWAQRPLVIYLLRVLSRHAFNRRTHLEHFPEVQALEDSPHADSDEPTNDPERRGAVLRARTKSPEEL
jgi:DNA-directed RNA polymerase specialized sigma24 family protein